MALNLEIAALIAPEGTEFPGTFQEFLDLLVEYLEITGEEDFSGINYGSTEPTADNRDRPWFRLDDEGNAMGWYSWTGASWDPIPMVLPRGTTAQRPGAPVAGQIFEDTDINVVLRSTGAAWITFAGSPGDIKYVKAETLSEALEVNPGWAIDTESIGMVIAGCADGSGFAPGDTTGEAEVMLTLDNLPSDAISFQSGWGIFPGQFQNGSQSPGVFPITTGLGSGSTEETGPINPNTQVGVSVYQPTIFRFCLYFVGT